MERLYVIWPGRRRGERRMLTERRKADLQKLERKSVIRFDETMKETGIELPNKRKEVRREGDRRSAERRMGERRSGPLLVICSYCKSVKRENETWVTIETFFSKVFNYTFSHGVCPVCWRVYIESQLGPQERRDLF